MNTTYKYFLLTLILIGQNAYCKGQFKTIEITTDDNIKIHAVYQVPSLAKTSNSKYPAVILIHQGRSSHEEWLKLGLLDNLLNQGFAILAYDVRLHGKSGKDTGDIYDLFNNPNRAPQDLLAVIKFLSEDKKIDPARIGILGASIGANLACIASNSEKYKIKSIVSMSAKTQAVINLSGIKEYQYPKNAYFIASKGEQKGMREKWAHELYSKTTGTKKIFIAKGEKHGSHILEDNNELQESIVTWFRRTL